MGAPTIRLALETDAPAIAAIYGPFCDLTPVSFEVVAPPVEEIAGRIRTTTVTFPWLVLEDDSVIAGYAYASRHRERAAYSWSVDVANYVNATHYRRGIGRALYTTLFGLLRLQGYFKAYAGITLPNDASVGLHQALGFTSVGIYRGVGYKHGAWHDVIWLQKTLRPEQPAPDQPAPLSHIVDSRGWNEAVSDGLALYRGSGLGTS